MRRNAIVFAGILSDIAMFFIALFLLYWGTWNYLFGSAVPGMGFGILMIISGAAIFGLGTVVALRLHAFLLSPSKKSLSAT